MKFFLLQLYIHISRAIDQIVTHLQIIFRFSSLYVHISGDSSFFSTCMCFKTILFKLLSYIFDIFDIVPYSPSPIPSDDSCCSKET